MLTLETQLGSSLPSHPSITDVNLLCDLIVLLLFVSMVPALPSSSGSLRLGALFSVVYEAERGSGTPATVTIYIANLVRKTARKLSTRGKHSLKWKLMAAAAPVVPPTASSSLPPWQTASNLVSPQNPNGHCHCMHRPPTLASLTARYIAVFSTTYFALEVGKVTIHYFLKDERMHHLLQRR